MKEAAERALKRIRSRTQRQKEWKLTEDTRDPTLQHIMTRIREIGHRSMTPARRLARSDSRASATGPVEQSHDEIDQREQSVDDHPSHRAGVRAALDGHGFAIAAEVGNAKAACGSARRVAGNPARLPHCGR